MLSVTTLHPYSATTWTGPLRTKLTNQSVNWEQRIDGSFFRKQANETQEFKQWFNNKNLKPNKVA